MVLAASERVRRRTQQRTRLTKMSRRNGPSDQLVCCAMHEREGNAGEQGTDDHCGKRPLRVVVLVKRTPGGAGEVFHASNRMQYRARGAEIRGTPSLQRRARE